MPIKPENRKRYPKQWPEIRARILARAGNRCEGSPKYPDCRVPNGAFRNNTTGEVVEGDSGIVEAWEFADGDSVTRIVLTVAHMDHIPENCDDDNLRALCQRCHLAHDLREHMQAAHATRRARRAIGELFT